MCQISRQCNGHVVDRVSYFRVRLKSAEFSLIKPLIGTSTGLDRKIDILLLWSIYTMEGNCYIMKEVGTNLFTSFKQTKEPLAWQDVSGRKLDGVGPVDNRPTIN